MDHPDDGRAFSIPSLPRRPSWKQSVRGNRNRLLVAMRWLWTYLFNTRGARLITDGGAPPAEQPAE